MFNMRKSNILYILLLIISFCFTSTHLLLAASYTASDLLGQFDAEGEIDFTNGDANGGVNDKGLFTATRYGVLPVAIDTVHHRLFVADVSNWRILVFNLDSSNEPLDYSADYVIGQEDMYTVVPSVISADHFNVSGIAYDEVNDRLFVSDYADNRVLVFDTTTISNGMDASFVLGQVDFETAATDITQAGLYTCTGIVYDSENSRLFVTQQFANRISVFDVTPENMENFMPASNVLGQSDFESSTGGTSATKMSLPFGGAYDAVNDRLFVTDRGNTRIVVFNLSGGITDGMPASNVLGAANLNSSGGGGGASAFVTNYAGYSGTPSYDGVNDRLFVPDTDGNRLVIFDLSGGITDGMAAANVLGQANFSTLTGTTTISGMSGPTGSSYDETNERLYVGDRLNNRVLVFDVDPETLTDGQDAADLFGQLDTDNNPVFNKRGANNSPDPMHLSGPKGLLLDSNNHRLFVADTSNNRVLVFNLDSSDNLADHTADYVLGQVDLFHSGAAATQDGMASPRSLAYDTTNDRLFVTDDFTRVLIFDVAPDNITNGMDASFVLGQVDFESFDTGTSSTEFQYAQGLAYDDANSRLFVSDSTTFGNNRVLVFDVPVGEVTDGMAATNVLGQANFDTGTSGTSAIKMKNPQDLLYDSVNFRLFVSDSQNKRVLVFDLSDGITDGMPAAHVIGQTLFTTSTSATSQTGLKAAQGMAYDYSNNFLFLADGSKGNNANSTTNRVLVYDVTPETLADGEPALAVLGQADFTSFDADTSDSGMYAPQGLAYDPLNNRLYVSEINNSRISIFDLLKISTSSLPSGTVGDAYLVDLDSNAQGTLSMTVLSGILPTGLTLATDGTLSGVPTTAGSSTFTIAATDTDSDNDAWTFIDNHDYTLTVYAEASAGRRRSSSGVYTPPPLSDACNPGDKYNPQTGELCSSWSLPAPLPA